MKAPLKRAPASKAAAWVMVMNVPELGAAPPRWEDVEAAFRGQAESPMLRTVLHLLAAQMATARRDHEGTGALAGDARAWCAGRADCANEVMVWLLRLSRDEGTRVPGWVVQYFGGRKHDKDDEQES